MLGFVFTMLFPVKTIEIVTSTISLFLTMVLGGLTSGLHWLVT